MSAAEKWRDLFKRCDWCKRVAYWTAGGGADAVLNACEECVVRTENDGEDRPAWERLLQHRPYAPDWIVDRVTHVPSIGRDRVRIEGHYVYAAEADGFRWVMERFRLLDWRYVLDGATFVGVRNPVPCSQDIDAETRARLARECV